MSEDFESIYQAGGWNGKGSGPGSTELFTREFRKVFERLLVDLKVRSVFDLGCGDWQWQRHLKWPAGIQYEGWDVSESAVSAARIAIQDTTANRPFLVNVMDAFAAPVWPERDLLLVKDIVHHLSRFRVRQLIERAKLYDYVIWVVDLDLQRSVCNWPGSTDEFMNKCGFVYDFDYSIDRYPFGPKSAFLQINP